MTERVTLKDIATAAGVSHNTVSLVVRGSDRVAPETRSHVMAFVDRMGYQPHAAAAALRQLKSDTVGYLISRGPGTASDIDVFRNQMWYGISDACEGAGRFVLQSSFVDVPTTRRLLRSGRVDGLMVDLHIADELLFDIAAESSIPIVVIGRRTEVDDVGWVRADEFGGAHAATSLLSATGGDVGLISVRDAMNPIVRERESGFLASLSEHDRAARAPFRWYGDWTFESGRVAAEAIAAMRERPRAVFALNELMAAGLLQGLASHAIRVPTDIAVATVEDSAWVDRVSPTLTGVHVPMYAVAQQAAEGLLAAVNGAEPVRRTVPTTLISRDSTASSTVEVIS